MALTRKFLTALGVEAEKVDEIIGAHSDTVNALKEERDKYKAQADSATVDSEEMEKIKTELQELKDAKTTTDNEWEKKYNDLKSEYDTLLKEHNTFLVKKSTAQQYTREVRNYINTKHAHESNEQNRQRKLTQQKKKGTLE